MEPAVLVELLSSYENEDSYIVWQGLASVLEGLDSVMSKGMRETIPSLPERLLSDSCLELAGNLLNQMNI
jgi:hypothetical protein